MKAATTTKRTAMKKANDRSVNSGNGDGFKLMDHNNNINMWDRSQEGNGWLTWYQETTTLCGACQSTWAASVSLLAVLINRIVSAIPPDPSSVAIVACDIKKSLDEISVNLSLLVSL
ncbi:hypothetical protein RHGRI_007439 [Rhododendron griersonianum]|uniref:Uncharacterized protein n=1 Tax=Rhododendron griersonianum TaxID=479676 RepID=A0AAV6KWS8_9ERIC|nr:hypothetical protein RHGRI_007439 [Rhododendron griersonianum]